MKDIERTEQLKMYTKIKYRFFKEEKKQGKRRYDCSKQAVTYDIIHITTVFDETRLSTKVGAKFLLL
jgi:hypothetical protein